MVLWRKFSAKFENTVKLGRFCSTNLVGSNYNDSPKHRDYYEQEGKDRRYFYLLDSRGQLFLEENKFKNYATCLKDKKFLDFFFKQLRPNKTAFHSQITYISPCGNELNFLIVDDPVAPIVFSELKTQDTIDNLSRRTYTLTIGGSSLEQSFDPHELTLNTSSGRMYHTIKNHKHLASKLGLLHPAVADILSEHLHITADDCLLQWEGEAIHIKLIGDE